MKITNVNQMVTDKEYKEIRNGKERVFVAERSSVEYVNLYEKNTNDIGWSVNNKVLEKIELKEV